MGLTRMLGGGEGAKNSYNGCRAVDSQHGTGVDGNSPSQVRVFISL